MEWAVITHVHQQDRERYGLLGLSDWDLVRRLRDRDGTLPVRAPSHTREGRCKYAHYYPSGNCPWCREEAV
jgi:hypothetical protein